MSQVAPRSQQPVRMPDEPAFAFCFDVLASEGSMPLTAMSSLLAPWGWTRDALLERMSALQDDGLVVLADVPASKKGFTPHVRVTAAGKHFSAVRACGVIPATRSSAPTEHPTINKGDSSMPRHSFCYRLLNPIVFLTLFVTLLSVFPGIASASPVEIKVVDEARKEANQGITDSKKEIRKDQEEIQKKVEIQLAEAREKSGREQAKDYADTKPKHREGEPRAAAVRTATEGLGDDIREASRQGGESSADQTSSGGDGVHQTKDITQSTTQTVENQDTGQQGSDNSGDNQVIENVSTPEDSPPTSESTTILTADPDPGSPDDDNTSSLQTESPNTAEESQSPEASDSEGKLSREEVYFPLPAENSDDFEDDFSENRVNGQHQANDISADEGTPVYSITSGTVVEVFVDSYGANVVRVQASESVGPVAAGDIFTYGHLYELPALAEGESVSAGEQIAISGNTGYSTGPHLHVGWETAGGIANPYDLWQWILDNSSSDGSLSPSPGQQPSPSSQPSPSTQPTQDESPADPDAILEDMDIPNFSFDD